MHSLIPVIIIILVEREVEPLEGTEDIGVLVEVMVELKQQVEAVITGVVVEDLEEQVHLGKVEQVAHLRQEILGVVVEAAEAVGMVEAEQDGDVELHQEGEALVILVE